MDNLVWIEKAKSRTKELEVNTEFTLKDLFDGVGWQSLKVGERLCFGKFFKTEVTEGHINNIVYTGKAQNNSAKYKKVI